ncbi:High molecular weight rubredoxin [candidate division WOR-3 bacterium]|nr:High molecular weight rubredoxin [candidate division WOR-3 bacterium]
MEAVGEPARCPVDPGRVDLAALNTLTYGLYVVTSRDGERRSGLVANTVVQVAGDPCEISVSINKSSLTHELVRKSGRFAVSVLEQETPLEFVGRFGFRSGRETDKLAGVRWHDGAGGCPLLDDHTLATIEARALTAVDCGSHTTFIGQVTDSRIVKPGTPLTYAYYHEVKGGRTGRGAATYEASRSGEGRVKAERKTKMRTYVCTVCGYVYDPENGDLDNGVAPGTPFEKLPDEWVCPVCGAGKDQFEPGE